MWHELRLNKAYYKNISHRAVLRYSRTAIPLSRQQRRQTGLLAAGLLRTSRDLCLVLPPEDITSVWSLPHTPRQTRGLVFRCFRATTSCGCLVGHPKSSPRLSSANGEDDKIQDFPGLSAFLPPDLQLHSLQNPLGQS